MCLHIGARGRGGSPPLARCVVPVVLCALHYTALHYTALHSSNLVPSTLQGLELVAVFSLVSFLVAVAAEHSATVLTGNISRATDQPTRGT